MSDKTTIKMPHSRTVSFDGGSVSFDLAAELEGLINSRLNSAQYYLDSEVLRRSAPYVPYLTGRLLESGYSSTVIGSGLVTYNTPYAKKQYYSGRTPGSSTFGPLRGKDWFYRMKLVNSASLTSGVAAVIGGEPQ